MTIKDIARECGCAVGTVSRVLNNKNYVSDVTRQKVLDAVNRHGFVPNKNAKELRANSKTIAIIVKGISNIHLEGILEIILSKLENYPYNASVAVVDEYGNEAQRAYTVLCERKPLGMIFLGGNPERYSEIFKFITIPCILISSEPERQEYENLSSICTDDFQASLFIARYLIKNGHSKIGVIGGDLSHSDQAQQRYDGFMEAVGLAGLDFDFERQYASTRYSLEGGAAAAEELMKKFPELTAIFAMSDTMAIGAVRKLREMGYSVPDDISVAGFDGLPISEYYCPRITTVRQSKETLAVQGLKALVSCIEKKSSAVHKMIPFEFIEGESVRKI